MEGTQDINMAIFEEISKLLMLEEFTNAQKTFFNKHKDTITDDEENKLEYTQIFEAYVTILEEIIAAKLGDTYNDAQIEAFYAEFAENLKKYEEINALAVNTLFGFTNFDKFKESILIFKKDEAASFQANEDDIQGSQEIANADESFYWKLKEENVRDPSTGWASKLDMKEKDGVKVQLWSKKMPDTKMNMMYSEAVYKGIKMITFFNFIKDFEKTMKDQPMIKQFKVLTRDENGYPEITYSITKAPMMSDRENLTSLKVRDLEDGSKLFIT